MFYPKFPVSHFPFASPRPRISQLPSLAISILLQRNQLAQQISVALGPTMHPHLMLLKNLSQKHIESHVQLIHLLSHSLQIEPLQRGHEVADLENSREHHQLHQHGLELVAEHAAPQHHVRNGVGGAQVEELSEIYGRRFPALVLENIFICQPDGGK